MLHRVKQKLEFECDECGEILQTDEAEFKEAVTLAKEAGWIFDRQGHNQWRHICGGCCS